MVEEGNSAAAKKRNDFLNWFWCHYLKAAAGATEFPPEHHLYKLPCQPLEGNTLASVTKESEAFGILVCLNCYKKWEHIVPQKVADKDWEIPKYNKDDADTHKFHDTEWSNGRNGQLKGEGWHSDAHLRLSELIKDVLAYRSAQKKENWAGQIACLRKVQELNGIDVGAKGPAKKKRKKNVPKQTYVAVEELSDEDCDLVELWNT